MIPPRGSTALQAGDRLCLVLRPETRPFVDSVFSQAVEAARNDLPSSELRPKGSTPAEDIRSSYDILLEAKDEMSVEDFVRHRDAQDIQVAPTSCQRSRSGNSRRDRRANSNNRADQKR